MDLRKLQEEYKKVGCFITKRRGIYYITKECHPLSIVKRFSLEAVNDIPENVKLVNECIAIR